MSMQSPELQSKIAVWRQRALEGTLTQDEMREAVKAMRGDRLAAASASENSRRKVARAVVPNADELLGELGLDNEGESDGT